MKVGTLGADLLTKMKGSSVVGTSTITVSEVALSNGGSYASTFSAAPQGATASLWALAWAVALATVWAYAY